MSLALPEFNLFGEAVLQPEAKPKAPTGVVYDGYCSTGAQLNPRERASLGRQAKALLSEGFPLEAVVAAARELGSERAFPGLLQQKVRAQPEICYNGTASLLGLSRQQVARCTCSRCTRWLEKLPPPPEVNFSP